MAEKKKLDETGMYNCTVLATGEKVIYHASTAQTLLSKGIITVKDKIGEYKPKSAK
jgi:hypothetical protein